MSEGRTGKRFPVQLPVTIQNSKSTGQGVTSDVSSAGVFVWVDADLKAGTKVEFDIILPGRVIGAKKDVLVRCRGRVVRTEEGKKAKILPGAEGGGKKQGVACVIENYKFIRKK